LTCMKYLLFVLKIKDLIQFIDISYIDFNFNFIYIYVCVHTY